MVCKCQCECKRSVFALAQLPASAPVLRVSAPVRRGAVADACQGLALARCGFFVVYYVYAKGVLGAVTMTCSENIDLVGSVAGAC